VFRCPDRASAAACAAGSYQPRRGRSPGGRYADHPHEIAGLIGGDTVDGSEIPLITPWMSKNIQKPCKQYRRNYQLQLVQDFYIINSLSQNINYPKQIHV